MTSETIIPSNTTSFLILSHFNANGNVKYNSFFRNFHMSDGLTLHETLIEKILHSGNKRVIIQIFMTSAWRVTMFSKFNDFSTKKRRKIEF